MMMNSRILKYAVSLIGALSLVTVSFGQQPAPAKKASEISVVMQDGTFIRGTIDVPTFEVETAYGKLSVPASDVVRIRVGKKANRELKARIDKLISELGSKEFRAREDAQQELSKIGKQAYLELETASRSTDPEISTRVSALLAEIELDEDEELQPSDDEIVTGVFVIRGTLKMEAFSLTTKLGNLKVEKKDVLSMTLAEPDFIAKTVKLTERNGVQGQWLDTGVRVKKGDRLLINASGAINWVSNGYVTEPRGNPNIGQWSNIGNQRINYGSLIGRIGSSAAMFYIGDKYTTKATAGGTLFLWIATGWSDQQATGEYKVKIEVRPAGSGAGNPGGAPNAPPPPPSAPQEFLRNE